MRLSGTANISDIGAALCVPPIKVSDPSLRIRLRSVWGVADLIDEKTAQSFSYAPDSSSCFMFFSVLFRSSFTFCRIALSVSELKHHLKTNVTRAFCFNPSNTLSLFFESNERFTRGESRTTGVLGATFTSDKILVTSRTVNVTCFYGVFPILLSINPLTSPGSIFLFEIMLLKRFTRSIRVALACQKVVLLKWLWWVALICKLTVCREQ